MNGPQHWQEADLILSGDPCEYGCPHGGCAHELRMIARAQVHAALALAAAYVDGAVLRPEDRDEWDRVTGRAGAGYPDGADPDRPETWAFGEPGPVPDRCPGCVGRGTGPTCCMCGAPVPQELRRGPGDPPELRAGCPDCAAGVVHVHAPGGAP